jgi:general L-amino acid transport system substrate-binding protein
MAVRLSVLSLLAWTALLFADARAAAQETLAAVRDRQVLRCAVSAPAAGFAVMDESGTWQGFDVDVCRAVAAAALGDADKVELVPLDVGAGLAALAEGDVDLAARAPFTAPGGPDYQPGVRFTTFTFLDGQGFMAPARVGPSNLLELNDRGVCVGPGEAGDRLRAFAVAGKLRVDVRQLETLDKLAAAFFAGECDLASAGRLELAALRRRHGAVAAAYEILPDTITRDMTGPYVKGGDRPWQDLVKWTVFALIQAEEHDIRADNVERIKDTTTDPRVRRFLGLSGGLGGMLGVDDLWVYRIVKQVGNYGEIYDRNLGPLALERGANALWRDGGQLHAMPFQ